MKFRTIAIAAGLSTLWWFAHPRTPPKAAPVLRAEPAKAVARSQLEPTSDLKVQRRDADVASRGDVVGHHANAVDIPTKNANTADTPSGNASTVETPTGTTPLDDNSSAIGEANQAVNQAWITEREEFYRDELEVTDKEMEVLKKLGEDYVEQLPVGTAIRVDGEETANFKRINDAYKNRVRAYLGDDRFERALGFQESFNASIQARFGQRTNVAGYSIF